MSLLVSETLVTVTYPSAADYASVDGL